MDENASRAVFLGVSVFVAIITITLIVNFYGTAKDAASVANRYDISGTENARVNAILEKEQITGLELRYLLDYYQGDDTIIIKVHDDVNKDGVAEEITLPSEDYWSDENQQKLDSSIRANYNYEIEIQQSGERSRIVATFIN